MIDNYQLFVGKKMKGRTYMKHVAIFEKNDENCVCILLERRDSIINE